MSEETEKKIANRKALAVAITEKHGPAASASASKLDEIKNEYGLEAYLAYLVSADFA